MNMVHGASAGVLGLLVIAGCGGSDGSGGKTHDFDHGTIATPGAGGGTVGEAPYWTNKPYPEGPYGHAIGSVIPPIELLGWKDPAAAGQDTSKLEPVSVADFYNPDGTKPGKVLFLDASAEWCPPCNAQYAAMKAQDFYAEEHAKGIEIFGALLEDAKNPPGPAKPSDIAVWTEKYDVHFSFAADPGVKTGLLFDQDAFPSGTIIDLRTMTIVAKHPGGGSDLETLRNELESQL